MQNYVLWLVEEESSGSIFNLLSEKYGSDIGNKIKKVDNVRELFDENIMFSGENANNLLEETVAMVLDELKIPKHLTGYKYIKTAIMLGIEDENVIMHVTKQLYPNILKVHNTTYTAAERAIRYAIEVSWARADKKLIKEIFGYTEPAYIRRPTNTEFLVSLLERVKSLIS